jgi:hypothetical protein
LFVLQIGCCIGLALVWVSYQTVRGALLCSCWLFAPCFSAIFCKSAVNYLKSWRAVLLLHDRWWEGTFACTLLPSDIAIIFCTILDNMTMKDYFSMLKSSVMPQCPAGMLIRVQPNTYIEKTEHFGHHLTW